MAMIQTWNPFEFAGDATIVIYSAVAIVLIGAIAIKLLWHFRARDDY